MAFADDPRFAAAVQREGGPQSFTIAFLRHVQQKGEDRLNPMEKSALAAIRQYGTEGFVSKVAEKLPNLAESEKSGKATGGGLAGATERSGDFLLKEAEVAASPFARAGEALQRVAPSEETGPLAKRALGGMAALTGGLAQFPEAVVKQVEAGDVSGAALGAVGATAAESVAEEAGARTASPHAGPGVTLLEEIARRPFTAPISLAGPFLIGVSILRPRVNAGEAARIARGSKVPTEAFIDYAKTVPFDAAELQRRLAQTQPLPGLAATQPIPTVHPAEVPQALIDARLAETQPFDLVPAGARSIPQRFRPTPPETGFNLVEEGGVTVGQSETVKVPTKGGGTFYEQHHEVTLPPETPVADIALEPALELGGEVAKESLLNPLIRAAFAVPASQPMAGMTATWAKVTELARNTMESARPTGLTLAKNKKFAGAAEKLFRYSDSEGAAKGVGLLFHRKLSSILGGPGRVMEFWDLMNDGQLRAAKARQEATGAPVEAQPFLSDAQRAALKASPRMAQARQWFKTVVMPELERHAKQANIESFRYDEDGIYSKLTVSPEVAKAPQGGGAGRIFRRRTARAAQQATGAGRYSNDSLYNLTEMFRDRYGAADQNAVLDMLKSYSVEVPKGQQPPEGYMFVGDTLPNMAAPVEIVEPYHTIRDSKIQRTKLTAIGAVRKFSTKVSLIGPFDAVSSFLRSSGALYRLPMLTGDAGLFTKTAALLGSVPRMAAVIGRAFNIHGPEAVAEMRVLLREGGLRASEFVKEGKEPTAYTFARAAFSMPNFEGGMFGGRSLIGYDTRFRIAYSLTLKHLGVTDPAVRASIINNEIGTHVKALQPALVKALHTLDPFSASHVASFKSQMKGILGINPASGRFDKYSPELLWANVGSLIVTPMVITKVATGKWPWEHKDLKPGDALITVGGKRYVVSSNLLMAPSSRALRAVGLRGAVDNWWNGRGDWKAMASEALYDSYNAFTVFAGPLAQFGYTLIHGKSVALNPRTGEQIQLAQKSLNQIRDRAQAAMSQIIQFAPSDASDATTSSDGVVSFLLGELRKLEEGVGVRPARPEALTAGGMSSRQRGQRYDIAGDVAFTARTKMLAADESGADFDPYTFVGDELMKRGFPADSDEWLQAYSIAIRQLKSGFRSMPRNAAETEEMRQERGLTDDETVEGY